MSNGSHGLFQRLERSAKFRYSLRAEEHDYSRAFRGRKVVIVGPNSQVDARDRTAIGESDVVVIMNKGRRMPAYPVIRRLAKRIAYFHCLDQSDVWGGGPLDSSELREEGFREVFYPLADTDLKRNVDLFHRNNKAWLKLRRIDPATYQGIVHDLRGYRPTSGLAIIASLAPLEGCDLYVTGITFYRKAYMPEYASHLQDLASIKAQMEGHGLHHPDLEFLLFKRLKERHGIRVDAQLESILQAPYQALFYTDPGDDRVAHP